MTTQHAIVLLEFAAIVLIGIGVWFIYWQAALIIVGVLILIGSQGFSRVRAEDGETGDRLDGHYGRGDD